MCACFIDILYIFVYVCTCMYALHVCIRICIDGRPPRTVNSRWRYYYATNTYMNFRLNIYAVCVLRNTCRYLGGYTGIRTYTYYVSYTYVTRVWLHDLKNQRPQGWESNVEVRIYIRTSSIICACISCMIDILYVFAYVRIALRTYTCTYTMQAYGSS
jgi:hypothetical protein